MEIIELSGYTLEEKSEIAKRYLLPKQLAANGLSAKQLKLSKDGVKKAIEGYTREAGVRSLERTIGSICRKIAVQYALDKTLPPISVDKEKVEELLGAPRFKIEDEKRHAEVGAITGLAWTAVGGTTLTVEVVKTFGKGDVKLTGQLGDVMKESAHAALTFIRSHAEKYGLSEENFTKTDLHIHVPEGATPKDGPSAGITIASAILSALTGKKARADIAMTGEITLRGKVLPIGGLKEKALAARRIGIKEVIIPLLNVKDANELPETVKKDVTFHAVSSVEEVFELVFGEIVPPTEPKKKMPKHLPVIREGVSEQNGVRC